MNSGQVHIFIHIYNKKTAYWGYAYFTNINILR